jgi:hypothetical protein
MNATPSTGHSVSITQRQPESAWLRIAKVLTLLVGLAIIFFGVMIGSLYLLLSLLSPQAVGNAPLNSGTVGFSMFAVSLALGGALIFQAVSSLSKRPSANVHLPPPSLFLVAFVVIVVLGVLISWVGHISWVLFPIFYVLGIALPVGWVMSVVAKRLRQGGTGITWRETILQISCGSFVTTSVALFLEFVAGTSLLALVIIAIMLTPGGSETLETLAENLQTPGWIDHPGNVEQILFSPVVMVGLFLLMSVAVPLIEEMVKAVGVIFMSYRRPTRERALWWGLLGGAGFTLVEGLFNSNLAIGDMSWGILAPMRFGTTILHCTTGALMGLGWYGLLQQKQPLIWLKRYGQSVGLHALWNALSLGLMFTPSDVSPGIRHITAPVMSGIILTTLLLIQVIAMLIALLHLTRKTASQETTETQT